MRPTWPSIIPLGATTRGAGAGLGNRGLGVDLERRVVVDVARLVEHATVPMVGVLVDAEVGDHDDVVADVAAEIGERELHDAVGIEGAAAHGVLVRGDSEQDHGLHAELGQLGHLGRRLSRECWTTPGSDGIGTGASMPSRTNSGATRSVVRTVVSESMSRIACVVRSRRNRVVGNIGAIVRAGPPTTDGTKQDGIVRSCPIGRRERGGDGGDDVVVRG